MPKWGVRESLMLAGAVLLMLVTAYCQGKKAGATDEKLAANKTATHVSDSITKSVQIRTDSAKAVAAVLDSTHDVIRVKVKVVHDTVTTPSGVYVDSTLAHLITVSDKTIAAQKRALALQDTLVASLRVGIKNRDERIKLLETRGTRRFSIGIQVGAGYCATANGNTPCIYAGYGVQLRLP